MRFLGLDVGTKTVGVALSDKSNTIATPLMTLKVIDGDYTSCFAELDSLVQSKGITDFVVGLPKNMDNSLGFASLRSMDFKALLEERFKLPVHLVDERLSTVLANRILISTNHSRQKRKKVVDSVAASLILDTFLKGKKGLK